MDSILTVVMQCLTCGNTARAMDCEPDIDGEGSLGCPLPNCGGVMVEEDYGDKRGLNPVPKRFR